MSSKTPCREREKEQESERERERKGRVLESTSPRPSRRSPLFSLALSRSSLSSFLAGAEDEWGEKKTPPQKLPQPFLRSLEMPPAPLIPHLGYASLLSFPASQRERQR